jgi:hypothetical protein
MREEPIVTDKPASREGDEIAERCGIEPRSILWSEAGYRFDSQTTREWLYPGFLIKRLGRTEQTLAFILN